jgi:hypothetical protein
MLWDFQTSHTTIVKCVRMQAAARTTGCQKKAKDSQPHSFASAGASGENTKHLQEW